MLIAQNANIHWCSCFSPVAAHCFPVLITHLLAFRLLPTYDLENFLLEKELTSVCLSTNSSAIAVVTSLSRLCFHPTRKKSPALPAARKILADSFLPSPAPLRRAAQPPVLRPAQATPTRGSPEAENAAAVGCLSQRSSAVAPKRRYGAPRRRKVSDQRSDILKSLGAWYPLRARRVLRGENGRGRKTICVREKVCTGWCCW